MQAKGLFTQTFQSWRQLADKEQSRLAVGGLMVLLFVPSEQHQESYDFKQWGNTLQHL